MKPCGHTIPKLGNPLGSLGCCRVCFLYETDPQYRALWDKDQAGAPFPTTEASLPRGECIHRGLEMRNERCPSCGGMVQIKVFACALHSECTLAKSLQGIACCRTCQNFEPAAGASLDGESPAAQ